MVALKCLPIKMYLSSRTKQHPGDHWEWEGTWGIQNSRWGRRYGVTSIRQLMYHHHRGSYIGRIYNQCGVDWCMNPHHQEAMVAGGRKKKIKKKVELVLSIKEEIEHVKLTRGEFWLLDREGEIVWSKGATPYYKDMPVKVI